MKALLTTLLIAFTAMPMTWAFDVKQKKMLKGFFSTHCGKCHGKKKQKGDLRLDNLNYNLKKSPETETVLRQVVEQLLSGEMPPKKKKKRPTPEESIQVISTIQHTISPNDIHEFAKETILRRLNRDEYDNTIKDLFHLKGNLFTPSQGILDDMKKEGFDNIGNALVTSDFLLNRYLASAQRTIEHATFDWEKPEPQLYQKEAGKFLHTEARMKYNLIHYNYTKMGKDHDIIVSKGGYTSLLNHFKGVPHSGTYKITVDVSGYKPKEYWKSIFLIRGVKHEDPSPFVLRVWGTDVRGLHLSVLTERDQLPQKVLKDIIIPTDDKRRKFTFEVYLEKGFKPRMQFINGPATAPIHYHQATKHLFKEMKKGKDEHYQAFNLRVFKRLMKDYKGPMIRVYDLQYEGPFYDTWPPESHVSLYGKGKPEKKTFVKKIEKFCERAFRRKVDKRVIDKYVAFYDREVDRGKSPIEAMQNVYAAVLCSPQFIYLHEGKGGKLNTYEVASRLSYFLWSTMPDTELLESAADPKMTPKKLVAKHFDRMLASPKSQAFVNRFTRHWLHLYKIDEVEPDGRIFQIYKNKDLQVNIKKETQHFFKYILHNDRSIYEFMDSDYSFVNPGLAELYGMKPVKNAGFQKVKLMNANRGGLLGQASILTASANGVDTSPIVRGIWMLENFVGIPVSPPPPNVEALEVNLRKAKTLKEALAAHRTQKSCNDCHAKIDPMGFAFENFDAIGQWRTEYRGNRRKVDASYEFEDGEEYDNIKQMKAILMENYQEHFAHCLTEKMLTYATGRISSIYQAEDINAILKKLDEKNNGLKSLVRLVANSPAFLSK